MKPKMRYFLTLIALSLICNASAQMAPGEDVHLTPLTQEQIRASIWEDVLFGGENIVPMVACYSILLLAVVGIVIGPVAIVHCAKRRGTRFPLMPKMLGVGVVLSVLFALLHATYGAFSSLMSLSGFGFPRAEVFATGISLSMLSASIGVMVAIEHCIFFLIALMVYHWAQSKDDNKSGLEQPVAPATSP